MIIDQIATKEERDENHEKRKIIRVIRKNDPR